MRTPDIDLAAAMLSRGASLDRHCPWVTEGRCVCFELVNVPEAALQDYRTGALKFSVPAFTSCRRYLLDLIASAR